jgi:hypothetical protein
VDVDLDCNEAINVAPFFLPPTQTFGRASKRSSHWLYISPKVNTQQYRFNRKMIVELRSTGAQTIFPPSAHEDTGESIEFENNDEIASISASDLSARVRKVAAAAILARVWQNAKGSRHEAALALAGGLRRAKWTQEETSRFLEAIKFAAFDPEGRDRLTAVKDTYAAADNEPTTGWPHLAELFGNDVVNKVREWLGVDLTQSSKPNASAACPDGLRVIQASTIVRKEVSWLWPGRIARRKLTLFQGNPGVGKSQVCLDIVSRVSLGAPWPVDNAPCPQGNTIVLAGEDDADDVIMPRLDALGADSSRIFIVDCAEDLDKQGRVIRRAADLEKDIDRISAVAQRHGDCMLIVIDPISEYLGSVDANHNAGVRALLRRLRELIGDLDAAAIMVNHLNKHGKDAISKGMGSIAFLAAARVAYHLCDDPNDPNQQRRYLLPIKSNVGKDDTGFAYRIVESSPGVTTVQWESSLVTVNIQDILAADRGSGEQEAIQEASQFLSDLLDDGPVPAKDVQKAAKECGHSWITVRRAKAALGINTTHLGEKGIKGGGSWHWHFPGDEVTPPISTFDDQLAGNDDIASFQQDIHDEHVASDEHLDEQLAKQTSSYQDDQADEHLAKETSEQGAQIDEHLASELPEQQDAQANERLDKITRSDQQDAQPAQQDAQEQQDAHAEQLVKSVDTANSQASCSRSGDIGQSKKRNREERFTPLAMIWLSSGPHKRHSKIWLR